MATNAKQRGLLGSSPFRFFKPTGPFGPPGILGCPVISNDPGVPGGLSLLSVIGDPTVAKRITQYLNMTDRQSFRVACKSTRNSVYWPRSPPNHAGMLLGEHDYCGFCSHPLRGGAKVRYAVVRCETARVTRMVHERCLDEYIRYCRMADPFGYAGAACVCPEFAKTLLLDTSYKAVFAGAPHKVGSLTSTSNVFGGCAAAWRVPFARRSLHPRCPRSLGAACIQSARAASAQPASKVPAQPRRSLIQSAPRSLGIAFIQNAPRSLGAAFIQGVGGHIACAKELGCSAHAGNLKALPRLCSHA